MANTLKDQGFRFMRRANGSFDWVHPAEKQPTDFDCTDMTDDEFADAVRLSQAGDFGEYEDGFNDAEADVCDGMVRNDFDKGSSGWYGYEFGVRLFSIARENWEAQAAYDARWKSLPDQPAY